MRSASSTRTSRRTFVSRLGAPAELYESPQTTFVANFLGQTNLIEGKFDIGVTAIDNVIAYMEGQGEAPDALVRHPASEHEHEGSRERRQNQENVLTRCVVRTVTMPPVE